MSFNTFDMSIGYTPTGNVTTFQAPNHVNYSGSFRSSISPLGKLQLAFDQEKEIIDLTEDVEIIDLTNEDDQGSIQEPTKDASTGFTQWIATTFSDGGLITETNAGNGIKNRVCTPYRPRKPMVSILAPIKSKKHGREHEQSVIHQCAAL
jgi:hypothetical protein